MKKEKVYAGIDPGKKGALAFIRESGITSFPTPTIGKEYDKQEMCNIIRNMNDEFDVHVVLENINSHSAKGRQTAFVMGKGVAYWEAFLVAFNVPHTMATPQQWQKVMWEGVPKQANTKNTSLLAAKRLFPGESFLASQRSSVPHDGMVDAVLIAEYCRRKIK